MENWKPIIGHEEFYEVSDSGKVRILPRLNRLYNDNGYPTVTLRQGTRGKAGYRVHTLVARAFLGPQPTPNAQVRHLNDDRGDNRVENLAWGTASDNRHDAVRNGKIKVGHESPNAKLNEMQRRVIRAIRRFHYHGLGPMLAECWGVSPALISNIATGRRT